ncbi:MAG: FAD-binding oxidoreductase, partial [Streptomyces sp.]|nr:FAD-binding oxidoreductase [Streptomyces sp.]
MPPFATARTALAALRTDLAGEVFAPDDPGYDAARTVCNARIDRRPAVIARCAGPADVVRAVRFARDLDLRIAVRGGGHSVAGMGVNDNGVVVDLRRMRGVTVHPGAAAVRVEGGALMRDLDRATQPYGLATPGGRDSASGVAGFVLGGGSGWLERGFGPAADQLLGVELVTADGSTVRATAEEHPELFWALHGGGGNFGVATALTLELHELPEFSLAVIGFGPEAGPDAIRAFREVVATGPAQAGGAVLYLTGRPESFVPGHLVGVLLCLVVITYAG